MFDETVSTFETLGSTTPINIPLSQWLRLTMDHNCEYVEQVREYRSTGEVKVKKALPSVSVGAVCEGGHSMEHVESRTGWIALDIDSSDNEYLSDPKRLRDQLANIIYIAFAGLSVSGKGVWALIRVKHPKKQARYFKQLQSDFKRKGIILDSTKGRNPNDLRFYSFDPNPYIADSFKVYDRLPEEVPTISPSPQASKVSTSTEGNDTKSKVEALISQIQANRIDITKGYDKWRDLGFALEDEFGEGGRDYFHKISHPHKKYTQKETDNEYTDLINSGSTEDKVTIATFFYWCKKYGVTYTDNHQPSISGKEKTNTETEDPAPYGYNPYTGEIFDERGYPSDWDLDEA